MYITSFSPSFLEDLTSLRSIAAILGGVSFGIFIFLLLCSVIYKKYMNSQERRDTCPPSTNENDYLDAVQAAAPPSYQTGLLLCALSCVYYEINYVYL